MRSISVRGRRTRSLVAVALAATIGIGAVASPAAAGTKPAKPAKVKVMSRNLYLGADLVPAIVAPTPAAARTAAGEIYKSVQDTNFIARAKLLAQEIENSNADLIGLQEVALWRRGQRGAADGPETPAEEVVYDFLDILQNQAIELIGSSGAVDTNKPVILVGDLNSDPDAAASEDAAAYNVIVGQEKPTDGGFADRGVEVNTCCFGSDLLDPPPAEFTSRIDHVLSRGDVTELDATLIGDDPALRTGTGLWPTDHGGVVAKLKVR